MSSSKPSSPSLSDAVSETFSTVLDEESIGNEVGKANEMDITMDEKSNTSSVIFSEYSNLRRHSSSSEIKPTSSDDEGFTSRASSPTFSESILDEESVSFDEPRKLEIYHVEDVDFDEVLDDEEETDLGITIKEEPKDEYAEKSIQQTFADETSVDMDGDEETSTKPSTTMDDSVSVEMDENEDEESVKPTSMVRNESILMDEVDAESTTFDEEPYPESEKSMFSLKKNADEESVDMDEEDQSEEIPPMETTEKTVDKLQTVDNPLDNTDLVLTQEEASSEPPPAQSDIPSSAPVTTTEQTQTTTIQTASPNITISQNQPSTETQQSETHSLPIAMSPSPLPDDSHRAIVKSEPGTAPMKSNSIQDAILISDDEEEQNEKDQNDEMVDEESEGDEFEYLDTSDDSDEENDYHPSQSARRMASALTKIGTELCSGTFSSGGELYTRVGFPGIQIKFTDPSTQETEFQYLSLPVTKHQAQELISIAKPKNSTRKSWFLTPDQFEVTNPAWNSMVGELIQDTSRNGLGVSPQKSISYQLSHMIVYEPNDQIVQEKPTMVENGFAKFIVQLPSACTGGEVIVTYRDNALKYDFYSSSPYLPSYLTYFYECEATECAIYEGYRLCLVYDITYLGPAKRVPSLDTPIKITDGLVQVANKWLADESPFVVYVCDSSSNLLDPLKGSDALVFDFLTKFNNSHQLFEIYNGIFEKKNIYTREITRGKYTYDDESSCDSESCDYADTSYVVRQVCGSNSSVISQTLNISVSDVVPYRTLVNLPSEDRRKEMLHNEIRVHETWKKRCLVIIPKKYSHLSLKYMDEKTRFEGFMKLYQLFRDQKVSKDLCLELAYSQHTSSYFRNNLALLIPIFISLNDCELVKKYLNPTPILELDTWRVLVDHFGVIQLKNEFLVGLVLISCNNFAEVEQKAQTCLAIVLSFNIDELTFEFLKKLTEKIDSIITSTRNTLSISFLYALVAVIFNVNYPITDVVRKLILRTVNSAPNIENYGDTLLQILNMLFKNNEEKTLCIQIFDNILQKSTWQNFEKSIQIVSNFIAVLGTNDMKTKLLEYCNRMININSIPIALKMLEQFIAKNEHHTLYLSKYIRKSIISSLQNSQINTALCQQVLGIMYKSGFKDDIASITSIIIGKSGSNTTELLYPLIRWVDKDLGREAFQHPGFNSILQYCLNFIRLSLGHMKGGPTEDWSIPVTVSCTCDDCKIIQAFLRDKIKVKLEFRKAESKRNHVYSSANTAAGKYLNFETVKSGSPHTLVITKTSTPQDAEKKRIQKVQDAYDYLNRLSSAVMSGNFGQVSPSSSSSSLSSNLAKRSSDASSSQPFKKTK